MPKPRKKITKRKSASHRSSARLPQSAAAAALGIAPRTLREWELQPWFPVRGRVGTIYDVALIVKAKPEDKNAEARKQTAEEREVNIRIAKAKAAKLEREEALESGQAVDRAEVELYLSELNTVVRDRIADFPFDLANVLPNDLRGRLLKSLPDLVPAKYGNALRGEIEKLVPANLRQIMIDEGEAKARSLLLEIKDRMDEVIEGEV